MKLLTKAIKKNIPALYGQDGKGGDAVAHAKLFTPDGNWAWYITEMNPETGECFGLVDGFEKELGYFSLKEVERVRGGLGLPVERDRWFTPCKLSDLKQ